MRVFLMHLPPLLKDLLSEALASESDLEVVGAAPDADVVVTQASSNEAHDLARELHAVGLIAIDPNARHALVFARRPQAILLSDLSPSTIIGAIRAIIAR
jgi:hypothetical protein